MDTDKANENLSTIQIPCRMDERGVLPVTNLSVHRCALAAEMVSVAHAARRMMVMTMLTCTRWRKWEQD